MSGIVWALGKGAWKPAVVVRVDEATNDHVVMFPDEQDTTYTLGAADVEPWTDASDQRLQHPVASNAWRLLQEAATQADTEPDGLDTDAANDAAPTVAAAPFVWTRTAHGVWVPAIVVDRDAEGYTLQIADRDQPVRVPADTVADFTDAADDRFREPDAYEAYMQLCDYYYGPQAFDDDTRHQMKKQLKRLKKLKRREQKRQRKEERRARPVDDAAADGPTSSDDEEYPDGTDFVPGQFVERLRAPRISRVGRAAAAALPVPGPLEWLAAGTRGVVRGTLSVAQRLYDEAAGGRRRANADGGGALLPAPLQHVAEFERDYLARVKQSKLMQLALAQFLRGSLDAGGAEDERAVALLTKLEGLGEPDVMRPFTAPPSGTYYDRPERVARIPGNYGVFQDPLVRTVSPTRMDVERRPLSYRTFSDAQSTGTDPAGGGGRQDYAPMRQWRALRDLMPPLPPDVQAVSVAGHVARGFNEERKRLMRKARDVSARLLGKPPPDQTMNDAYNTQFDMCNFAAARLLPRRDAPPATLSVGPSPAHLGAATPALPAELGAAASAQYSEAAASQIHLADDEALPFVISREPSRARSVDGVPQASAPGSRAASATRAGDDEAEVTPDAAPAPSTRPWKRCAAQVITRVLTPYLRGTHGYPVLIRDDDEFQDIARSLSLKAEQIKLKQAGLAPEMRFSKGISSPFTEEEGDEIAAAVQRYMKNRGSRRRGRSESSAASSASRATSSASQWSSRSRHTASSLSGASTRSSNFDRL